MNRPRMSRKRWIALLILVLAGIAAYTYFHEESPDPRYNGAYGLPDGRWAFVTARTGGGLRFTRIDGASWPLWPAGKDRYEAGPGWSERTPVEFEADFAEPEVSDIAGGVRYSRS